MWIMPGKNAFVIRKQCLFTLDKETKTWYCFGKTKIPTDQTPGETMALRRKPKPDTTLLVKSAEDMRQELRDTLYRLDESIEQSSKTLNDHRGELAGWETRAGEAEECMGRTDDRGAQEAFQMLHVQAIGYMRQYRSKIETETKLLNQRIAQAEELRQAVNRLSVENIKEDLRREIASSEITGFKAVETETTGGNTITEESEREIQRLILSAEALLEIKA